MRHGGTSPRHGGSVVTVVMGPASAGPHVDERGTTMNLSGLQRLILEAAAEGRVYEAPGSEGVIAQEYDWLRDEGLVTFFRDGGSLTPLGLAATLLGRDVLELS